MPILSFLCASLRRSKSSKGQKEEETPAATTTSSLGNGKLVSGIGVTCGRALVAAVGALSCKRGEPGEGRPLWKKTILMGEKCRKLEFSGRILYDSEGNQVLETPQKSPIKKRQ